MSAEGTPQAESSLFSRPLEAIVRLSARFPVATLAIGVLVAVASVFAAYQFLSFRTSRADLLNPKSRYHQRWLAYTQEFGEQEDVVVVVEGENAEAVVPVVKELAGVIAQEPRYFQDVLHEVALAALRAKGLYFLEPSQLARLEPMVAQAEPILRDDWSQFVLGKPPGAMAAPSAAAGGMPSAPDPRQLAQFSELLWSALHEDQYRSALPDIEWPAEAGEPGPRRFLSDDGRLGFLLLKFVPEKSTGFARNAEALDALRRIVADAAARRPETRIGLTGLPVMENDEMQAGNSSTTATVLSLLGVAVVFMAGFGGLRYPMTIAASLFLAVIWSLGYVVVAVGHLNILSSAFGAILIGLGDYGVHFVAQYLHLRGKCGSTADALAATARTVGPSITTAALTMAGAFFATSLTEFTGVAELGIIAGGGILLCWLSDLTVLPALIQLIDRGQAAVRPVAPLDLYAWFRPIVSGRAASVGVMIAATLLLALGISRLRYDYNLLNLQPQGLESVRLQQELVERTKRSSYFALSMADSPEKALAQKEAFLRLDTVERVEEVASLFPEGVAAKEAAIRRIHGRLGDLPRQPPLLPVVPPQQLDQTCVVLGGMMQPQPGLAAHAEKLQQVRLRLRKISEAEYYQRMSTYQQAMAGDVLGRLRTLQTACDPTPPGLGDLPPALVHRFVGKTGRYVLHVYCKGDIWDKPTAERFVRDVRSVDPEATGNPLQIYEASRQMNESYVKAACYALAVIVVILLFDFRSVGLTLLALSPLFLGMLQLFGLMGWLGIPLNPANMIVLPLILGIGIDTGVHIVHDFHLQGNGYRRTSSSTATAVVVNSLTTMVGFGSLMVASHQGLQSLGRVLTLGITCCLLTALVLPNLLVLFASCSRRSAAPACPSPEPAADPDEPLSSGPPVPIVRREPAPSPAAPDDEKLRPAA